MVFLNRNYFPFSIAVGFCNLKNEQDLQGNSALHIACYNNCFASIKRLIAHGFAINALNHDGETPLHLACRGPRVISPIVRYLLEYGADPRIICGKGKSAQDVARAEHLLNTLREWQHMICTKPRRRPEIVHGENETFVRHFSSKCLLICHCPKSS